mmetsp:Transcript_32177/g.55586  ORF Transcript_32177/g.55586 Transcript_32177/m.55586 type:complete len:109 (+) Transcript_32177:1185-1511(+)
MGCTLCVNSSLRGPLEINYDSVRVSLSRRPENLNQLFSSINQLIGTTKPQEEIVVEYLSNDGIRAVTTEVALHEAYILHENKPLVFGVRVVPQSKLASTEPTREFDCK